MLLGEYAIDRLRKHGDVYHRHAQRIPVVCLATLISCSGATNRPHRHNANRSLVHALQDSRTVFILMASFSAPPRPLPASIESSSEPGVWDPDAEHADDDKKYDDKKDEPGITETLKFDKFANKFASPDNATSQLPHLQKQARQFQPSFQKPFPPDITPFAQCKDEVETWESFLQRAKERGVDLGSKARGVQNYIKVGGYVAAPDCGVGVAGWMCCGERSSPSEHLACPENVYCTISVSAPLDTACGLSGRRETSSPEPSLTDRNASSPPSPSPSPALRARSTLPRALFGCARVSSPMRS